MPRHLLDASAVLAFMSSETGAARVRELLLAGEAAITAVNLAELAGQLIHRGMAREAAEHLCRSMGLEILPVDAAMAFAAAALVPSAAPLGLSLGDRICLAAAGRGGSTAVTADRAWSQQSGVAVEVIR
jgi:PIN domain nuclease of toxin-antitoxin system